MAYYDKSMGMIGGNSENISMLKKHCKIYQNLYAEVDVCTPPPILYIHILYIQCQSTALFILGCYNEGG
jgi:hypothetical protein